METVAVAPDAPFVAERLDERLAERDTAVLDRVVGVDMEVAFAAELQVADRMLGERREHVVEESDAGLHIGLALAVDGQGQGDVRLGCGASDGRGAQNHGPS